MRGCSGNTCKHDKKQISQIPDIIRRLDFNYPVPIDDSGQVVYGHGRLAAAKLLALHATTLDSRLCMVYIIDNTEGC